MRDDLQRETAAVIAQHFSQFEPSVSQNEIATKAKSFLANVRALINTVDRTISLGRAEVAKDKRASTAERTKFVSAFAREQGASIPKTLVARIAGAIHDCNKGLLPIDGVRGTSPMEPFVLTSSCDDVVSIVLALAPWSARLEKMKSDLHKVHDIMGGLGSLVRFPPPKEGFGSADVIEQVAFFDQILEGTPCFFEFWRPVGTLTLGLPWLVSAGVRSFLYGAMLIPSGGLGWWCINGDVPLFVVLVKAMSMEATASIGDHLKTLSAKGVAPACCDEGHPVSLRGCA